MNRNGPQGVLDVVNMTGTLAQPFAGLSNVGEQVHLQWVIYFPWEPESRKFKGETIYAIRPLESSLLTVCGWVRPSASCVKLHLG